MDERSEQKSKRPMLKHCQTLSVDSLDGIQVLHSTRSTDAVNTALKAVEADDHVRRKSIAVCETPSVQQTKRRNTTSDTGVEAGKIEKCRRSGCFSNPRLDNEQRQNLEAGLDQNTESFSQDMDRNQAGCSASSANTTSGNDVIPEEKLVRFDRKSMKSRASKKVQRQLTPYCDRSPDREDNSSGS